MCSLMYLKWLTCYCWLSAKLRPSMNTGSNSTKKKKKARWSKWWKYRTFGSQHLNMDLINQCLRTNIYDVVGDIKHNVSDLKVYSNTWEVKLGTQWICLSSSLSHYSLSIRLLHINEHLLQSSHVKFTQLWWSQPAAVSGSAGHRSQQSSRKGANLKTTAHTLLSLRDEFLKHWIYFLNCDEQGS